MEVNDLSHNNRSILGETENLANEELGSRCLLNSAYIRKKAALRTPLNLLDAVIQRKHYSNFMGKLFQYSTIISWEGAKSLHKVCDFIIQILHLT